MLGENRPTNHHAVCYVDIHTRHRSVVVDDSVLVSAQFSLESPWSFWLHTEFDVDRPRWVHRRGWPVSERIPRIVDEGTRRVSLHVVSKVQLSTESTVWQRLNMCYSNPYNP